MTIVKGQELCATELHLTKKKPKESKTKAEKKKLPLKQAPYARVNIRCIRDTGYRIHIYI